MENTKQEPIDSGFGERSTAQEVIKDIRLDGKTAIVTGGHSGIGLETTRVLCAAGAHVIVGARDIAKASAALAAFNNISVLPLDLSEPTSVTAFTDQIKSAYTSCELLVNNAGIMATPLERNRLGHEAQFATNHLGHFQLTLEIWDLLLQNGARVVNLSSLGHRLSAVDFDDPDFLNRQYNKWLAYGQSKTANALFAVHLDKLGKNNGIRAFSVHPGRITTTGLSRYMSKEEVAQTANAKPADTRFPPSFVKTLEQGAATSIWCATSPLLEHKGGVYCADCDISPLVDDQSEQTNGVRRWAIDEVSAEKLWNLSLKWVL